MIKHIYDQEEFIKKTGIEKMLLDKLIDSQVLMPAGQVDGSTPYFDDSGLEAADTIIKLLEIGYSPDEVIRIRRKVGIPSKGAKRLSSSMPLLTVGELAQRIGSNPRTIKHWEEKGLIEPESYTPGGFRLYPESYVKICRYIQDLQLFGYTLDEIKVLAGLVRDYLAYKEDEKSKEPEETSRLLQQMKEQMDHLNSRIKLLEKGIERWRRLLKQRGKEISSLSAKISKEITSGQDASAATAESQKSASRSSKPKKKQETPS